MEKITKGLIITFPYATYIKNNEKTIIVKSRNFKNISNHDLLLIENKIGLGVIKLDEPYSINLKEFKKIYNLHLITDEDRVTWWKDYKKLYVFKILFFKKYNKPVLLDYPLGPQVTVNMNNIIFKKVFIGTSGFIVNKNTYNLNSVEINYTFYQFPSKIFIENLSKLDLVYSIKVPKIITHLKQLLEVNILWNNFYKLLEPIHNKIKCFLFQFSSHFLPNKNSLDKIKIFSKILNKNHFYVFEFRNDEWFNEKNITFINSLGIIVCSLYDFSRNYLNIYDNIFYLRLHGTISMYKGSYDSDKLEKIYNFIKKNRIYNSFIYFNNTINNTAVLDSNKFNNLFNKINL